MFTHTIFREIDFTKIFVKSISRKNKTKNKNVYHYPPRWGSPTQGWRSPWAPTTCWCCCCTGSTFLRVQNYVIPEISVGKSSLI